MKKFPGLFFEMESYTLYELEFSRYTMPYKVSTHFFFQKQVYFHFHIVVNRTHNCKTQVSHFTQKYYIAVDTDLLKNRWN